MSIAAVLPGGDGETSRTRVIQVHPQQGGRTHGKFEDDIRCMLLTLLMVLLSFLG